MAYLRGAQLLQRVQAQITAKATGDPSDDEKKKLDVAFSVMTRSLYGEGKELARSAATQEVW